MLRSVAFNVGEVIPSLTAVPQPVKVANFCKNKTKTKIMQSSIFCIFLFSVNKNVNVTTLGTTTAGRFLVWKKSVHVQEREREKEKRKEREREID